MAENKYTALTDEQLALQAQNGDAEAEEYLLTRFKDMVLSRAAIYYIVGGDRDDVVQEGMIGLVKAIRGYKEEQGSFSNFAYVCITRQIISAVRSASREKHGPLNDAISLDQPISWSVDTTAGGATLGETIPAGEGSDPAEVAIKTELLNIIMSNKNVSFSKLEHATIKYLTQGKNYREIAEMLAKSPKQIDNAIQRIREKLQKL
ncbi:MAG: sigma-70 family RNA polymerase sigma factor [Firmicutes bacterium]|nr:sigma-70 family RNA polymerase sigma factor [Bacillota bacterium]